MKVANIVNYSLSAVLASVTVAAYAQEGNPPPCTEVKEVKIATDPIKRKALFSFIQSCIREHWFSSAYDKGIIHLYEYHNSQNELCWRLYPRIDDLYKDNPPNRFADFDGDIILIYDADSTGRVQKTVGDKASLNQCLEQIIGDRVFRRPITKKRWTSAVIPHINEKQREGNRRYVTGGVGEVIIRFNKDGSYTISHLG